MKDTSKQAFPAMDMNHREGVPSMELRYEGMTLLEYYVAHAPIHPQGWFEPVMSTEREEITRWMSHQDAESVAKKIADWDNERFKQKEIQWPLAWAKEQIKQLDTTTEVPFEYPERITVGLTVYTQEKDDKEYYNVDGRAYFERIHFSRFPAPDDDVTFDYKF